MSISYAVFCLKKKKRRSNPLAADVEGGVRSRLTVLCHVWPSLTPWNVWFFFFNDTATTEIYTLSLHDALPILDVQLTKILKFMEN